MFMDSEHDNSQSRTEIDLYLL